MKATIYTVFLAALACSMAAGVEIAPDPSQSQADEQAIQQLRDMGISPSDALALIKEAVQSETNASPEAAASIFAETDPAPAEPKTFAVYDEPADPAAGVTEVIVDAPEVADVRYFNDMLAPYGTWISVSGYGRVWRPYAAVINTEWRPYCHEGRWISTNRGWYWQSYYSWGWAPFHYGRWVELPNYRWCWVPDTTWAPAWVFWRNGSTYVGWAPLPPGTWWRNGYALPWNPGDPGFTSRYGLSHHSFTFVERSHFHNRSPSSYSFGHDRQERAYRDSSAVAHSFSIDNQGVVNNGIQSADIASSTAQIVVRNAPHRNPAIQATTASAVFEGMNRETIQSTVAGVRAQLSNPNTTPQAKREILMDAASDYREQRLQALQLKRSNASSVAQQAAIQQTARKAQAVSAATQKTVQNRQHVANLIEQKKDAIAARNAVVQARISSAKDRISTAYRVSGRNGSAAQAQLQKKQAAVDAIRSAAQKRLAELEKRQAVRTESATSRLERFRR